MDTYIKKNESQVKELRRKNMLESLAAMRKDGHVDVTLVCGDKEYGAHRLVLEASSPYFLRMFRSEMEEAKTGKVFFNSLEPDTLEAILNYIYLGEVKMINTEQQVIEVLAAAHMMELTSLSQFCFEALSSLLSKDNCDVIWNISNLYDHQTLKTAVLEFALANFKELKDSNLLLEITDKKWKDLLNFAVSKQVCLDEMLKGIIDWLRHDFDQRKIFTVELFACIEAKFLTCKCLKEFIRDKSIMAISPEIGNKMNELGVALFFLSDGGRLQGTIRFVCKLSEVSIDLRSSSIMIQNLQWNILIKYVVTTEKKKKIGFYVECNRLSKEQSWSCKAKIEYRMVSHDVDIKPRVRNSEDLFSSGTNSWGYENFTNPYDETYYLAKDTASFEAEITADAPQGICD